MSSTPTTPQMPQTPQTPFLSSGATMSGARSQWMFTDVEVVNCPSSVSLTQKDIGALRQSGCEFIDELFKRLRDRLTTEGSKAQWTAFLYYQRFFQRKSFVDYDYRDIASAAFFLSLKVADVRDTRGHHSPGLNFSVEDVVIFVHYCKNEPRVGFRRPDERGSSYWGEQGQVTRGLMSQFVHSHEYEQTKKTMVKYESELIAVLCFDLDIDTGFNEYHSQLESFQALNRTLSSQDEEFAKRFWRIAFLAMKNAIMTTTLSLEYPGKGLMDAVLATVFVTLGSSTPTGSGINLDELRMLNKKFEMARKEDLRQRLKLVIDELLEKETMASPGMRTPEVAAPAPRKIHFSSRSKSMPSTPPQ